jgi:acyl carrier protein
MIQEKLTAILEDIYPGFDAAAYTGGNSHTFLLLSSIQMMNLMLRIENIFDITIEFEEVDITQLNSVAAFEELIKLYLNKQ